MQTVEEALCKLSKSKFRSSFHLTKKEREYAVEKGMDVLTSHARDIIHKRLSPSYIENDGRQTPTRGHPVFKAQHACACCCRSCLNKWYKVPKNVELTGIQEEKIVRLLMKWIEKEMNKNK
ncbi:MAG: DUF4186 domain-containing protein [Clostridia bacterium]|nr:DUF4186 domain-containing protein [Clostridia bacterium]